jgi:hypothetical protein
LRLEARCPVFGHDSVVAVVRPTPDQIGHLLCGFFQIAYNKPPVEPAQ